VNELLIGLDLGTSSLKAGLFSTSGALLRMQRESYELYSPRPGWVEQDPADWWAAAARALRHLTEGVPPGQIVAVGLAGQCPSHVLVDEQGQALGRAILWRDRRATAEAEWIAAHIPNHLAKLWTGSERLGDAALPPARLRWLKEHRADDWRRARAVLQPKDYLALRLTGQRVTDRNSAFCLAAPGEARYCPEFFEALEVPLDVMPPIIGPASLAGRVTAEAAQATGLAAGTPVAIGTIDAHCEIIGAGALTPSPVPSRLLPSPSGTPGSRTPHPAGAAVLGTSDDSGACGLRWGQVSGAKPASTGRVGSEGEPAGVRAVDVAGTTEIIALSTNQPISATGVFGTTIDDDTSFVCGPMQMGGEALRWLARGFYHPHPHPHPLPLSRAGSTGEGEGLTRRGQGGGEGDIVALEAEASSAPPGCDGAIFLPYLDGERAPIWDVRARGALVGLTSAHGRAHFARAVYEGIAFAVRHVLEACESACGTSADEAVVCGGGSRSAFWNQIKSNVLNRPVRPTAIAESACLGAAMLASVAIGLRGSLAEAGAVMSQFQAAFTPQPEAAEVYDSLYGVYRELYPALRSSFHTLGNLAGGER
jgi:xylulokinase